MNGNRAWLIVALAIVGLSGCGDTKVEPTRIGHVVPMSGPRDFLGDRARQAIRLALERLNAPETRGGLRPILVQHADGHDGPATATRLVKIDRVYALLDQSDPVQLAGIASSAAANETPVVTVNPWVPTPPNDFVCSLAANPAFQGRSLARFAREELKLESLVVWSDGRVPACTAMADAFNQEWLKAGGRSGPGPMAFDPDKDAGRVEQLKSARPAAVVFFGGAERLLQVRSLLNEAELTAPVLFAGDEAAAAMLAGGPQAGGKVFLATAFAIEELTAEGQEFAKTFPERFGGKPDAQAVFAFDGIRLLTEVLRKAPFSNAGIAKELRGVEAFATLTGPLSFAKDGSTRRSVFVVEWDAAAPKLAKKYEPDPQ